MAYESRTLKRQKVRHNSDNDDNALTYQLVVDGAKVTPTSATITIYAPGNSTALVSAQAMTKSGSLLTYSPDTTTTTSWPKDEGYRADIVVTYNSLTYDRHLIFDVVGYLLDIGVGRDQLVALDDNLSASEHGGDSDFSELIESCRDEIQLLLETKAVDDGELIENMIIDPSRVAIPARRYILAQYYDNKGDIEKADRYMEQFEKLFRAMLSGIKYDTDQDGAEESTQGSIQTMRLIT